MSDRDSYSDWRSLALAIKDVDLAAQQSVDLGAAERALTDSVASDLGDHLTFRLIRSAPTGLGDTQPGVATRRYVFACIDVDHDTPIDTVTVDIVVGPPPVGHPQVVEPANRLLLRRPLVTYPSGKRSSRVKDLVDLVVLAHTQSVDLHELGAAIAAKRILNGLAPFAHFDIPSDWARTYPTTARGVPSAEPFTAETAAALVAAFIDPALSNRPNTGTWDPRNLAWSATPSVPSAYPEKSK